MTTGNLFSDVEPVTASPRFAGSDYVPARDDARLGAQLADIFALMKDGEWRTLHRIHCATGHPPASVSAQLRNLRKLGHTVNKRHKRARPLLLSARGEGMSGSETPDRDPAEQVVVISEADQERLEALFRFGATAHPALPEHWVAGGDSDESISYCLECAEKEIASRLTTEPHVELFVNGGWRDESDYVPHCETCGRLLVSGLTNYGAEQELDHFIANGFNADDNGHCRALYDVVSSIGWIPFPESEPSPMHDKLKQLAARILLQIPASPSPCAPGEETR